MKRFSLAILLGLFPVVAVIVYVAFAATIICPAAGCTVAGNPGTANADTFIGSGAADAFAPRGGNDVIYGGAGAFADTVPCAAAADCAGGNKFFAGGSGNDVFGEAAGALLTGNDKFFGEDGVDDSNIGPGNDYVDCGPGADANCDGFGDNDIIIGGQGTDVFTAANNAGDDVFIVFFGDAGGAAEDLQCGPGTDVVIFVGFGNRIFAFPVQDAGAGTFTNVPPPPAPVVDCEILIGG